MKITECAIPAASVFSRDHSKFYYWDSFEAPLSRTELSMHALHLGIFSHPPGWLKWLLIIRSKTVSLFGIKGPTTSQINNVEIKEKYILGEKIGLFTLYSQDAKEIITGGNDKHLDFRVSVLKVHEGGVNKLILTTVVSPHNLFGKAYLFLIVPFHKLGVKTLMSNAVAANRM